MIKFVGLYRILDHEIKVIKYGIARDGYINLFDKLEYIIKGETDLRSLKEEVIKIVSKVSNEKIIENKMYYKMCISKLNNINNNSVAIAVAIISILISTFSILLEQVLNVVYNSPEMLTASDIEKTYELLINNLYDTTNTLALFFALLICVLLIGVVVSWYKSKKKRDSIIYYEFMYSCMEIVEEKRKLQISIK